MQTDYNEDGELITAIDMVSLLAFESDFESGRVTHRFADCYVDEVFPVHGQLPSCPNVIDHDD